MVWATPIPPAIDAFRDMLVACAGSVAFGLVQARFHYPSIDMNTSGSATRPCCLLDQVRPTEYESYAEKGVTGNPSGTLTATIYAESSVSTMEDLAATLCREVQALSTGLFVRSATPGRCSDLNPGQRAADDTTADNKSGFRSIMITVEWGLSP